MICAIRWCDPWQVCIHVFLSEVDVLEQALTSLFHFNQATFEPLPEFVIGSPAYVTCVPNVVLDEFLNLVFPLSLEHDLFDGLDCDHEAMYVLNEHVIARYEELLSAGSRGHTLKITG